MVEPIMYLAIGFLLSMLCGLALMPLVHNRAVRLTRRRIEAATPLSMAEIQADKDQLRAEFAMSVRRLETNVEVLKTKTATQLAELGRKADAINRMKIELDEKNVTILAIEARERATKDQLRTAEEEFSAKTEALRTAEQALTDRQKELAKITAEHSMTAETREVELVSVRIQIEQLKRQFSDAEKDFAAAQAKLTQERSASETAAREISDTQGPVEKLNERVADLEGQLTSRNKLLAKHVHDESLLRQAKAKAEHTIKELREEIASAKDDNSKADNSKGDNSLAAEKLHAEKAVVEQQLRIAREERTKLQREIQTLQQRAESSSATERTENALLRERINDIAAEVARLAIQLEGPDSPIETLLAAEAGDAPKTAPATNGAAGPTLPEGGGTLAERIRALQAQAQAQASRTRQQGP